ncbi:MAG: HIT domain-containing protein [Deltaproteobacteria bacterium]|nr:HIT domain-containing protein [Deltaproteobacteria bacterium]
MKQIFAPWRMTYISQEDGARPGCPFCDLPAQGACEDTLILWKGPAAFVILNRYPYVSGHLLIVPNRHVDDPVALPPDEWAAALAVVPHAVAALREVYRPHGFNIGMNVGRAAGAGIDGHIHVHVVPRWGGDTNFVPVLSDTRVIPEALEVTYRRLLPSFERLDQER